MLFEAEVVLLDEAGTVLFEAAVVLFEAGEVELLDEASAVLLDACVYGFSRAISSFPLVLARNIVLHGSARCCSRSSPSFMLMPRLLELHGFSGVFGFDRGPSAWTTAALTDQT